MKILHTVESYLPARHGMQEVVTQISEALVKSGHEVTVATGFDCRRKDKLINGARVEDFKISGNEVKGYVASPDEITRYENFLLDSNFDIITNFNAQNWATDLALPLLVKIKAKKVFVPTGFSALHDENYQEYFNRMKVLMKGYDMNVFLSEDYQDIDFAKENGVAKRILIPNGAGAAEFSAEIKMDLYQKLNIPKDVFLILNVGSHTGIKGHQEAMEIFAGADIKKAVLLIVANGRIGCCNYCRRREKKLNRSKQFRDQEKQILVRDLKREQTLAAYHEADLFLFPSNIECSPIVLFEAMASKTPFLATDVGNVKEIINWTGGGCLLPTQAGLSLRPSLEVIARKTIKKILIKLGLFKKISLGANFKLRAAKIDESVKLLEKIYHDRDWRLQMAASGYAAWQKNFTWEKIASQYETLYKKLVEDNL
jgi:L-malate glycosyltransferase